MLNERFVNLPPDVAVPLFDTLHSDLQIAAIKYDYFLLVTKAVNDRRDGGDEEGNVDTFGVVSKSSKKRKRSGVLAALAMEDKGPAHTNQEDPMLLPRARQQFVFTMVQSESDNNIQVYYHFTKYPFPLFLLYRVHSFNFFVVHIDFSTRSITIGASLG